MASVDQLCKCCGVPFAEHDGVQALCQKFHFLKAFAKEVSRACVNSEDAEATCNMLAHRGWSVLKQLEPGKSTQK